MNREQPNNIIHVTIRPTDGQLFRTKKVLVKKNRYLNKVTSISSASIYSPKQTSSSSINSSNTDRFHCISSDNFHKSSQKKNHHNKRLAKGHSIYCCCCCSCSLCLSLLAVGLLLCIIATVITVLLIFPKTKTTMSSSTTTVTTSTTTSITTITTSTTTTTVSTSTTTTTTSITTQATIAITRAGDSIVELFNTTAGSSTGGKGYSIGGEGASRAIDNSTSSKYLNFGYRGISPPPSSSAQFYQPGAGTGYYVTPSISSASVATTVLFATANDFRDRDPISMTLEGTNATGAALDSGSSWTLIYSGSTGIDPINDPGRSTYVTQQVFSNTIAFRSYRLLITAQQGNGSGVQYSEAQIYGYI